MKKAISRKRKETQLNTGQKLKFIRYKMVLIFLNRKNTEFRRQKYKMYHHTMFDIFVNDTCLWAFLKI